MSAQPILETTFVTYTLAEHEDFSKKQKAGEVTADQVRGACERAMSSKEALIAELSRKTIKELSARSTRSGEKKAVMVKQAYSHILQSFTVGDCLSWSPFTETFEAAIWRVISGLTNEKIQEAAAKRKAEIAELQKTLTNPETLAEFNLFVHYRGESALTPAQLVEYDRLRTGQAVQRRHAEAERRAEVSRVDLESAGMLIKEGWHTKHNCKLWIVQLTERVEGDTFKELAQKARQLGGNYSSFGPADQRGFQFREEEDARRFTALKEGSVSGAEDVAERREESAASAADRLRSMAGAMDSKASESLTRERRVNTHRQARMAANSEADARREQAFARTLARVADAIQEGALALSGIRHRSHVEALESSLRRARYDAARVQVKEHGGRLSEEFDKEPTIEDVTGALYPFPWLSRGFVLNLAAELEPLSGCKLLAGKMRKLAALLPENDEYKQVGHSYWVEKLGDVVTKTRHMSRMHYCGALKERMADMARLGAAGIMSTPELRTSLREYLPLREGAAKPDPIAELERELIGGKIAGFFPTPAPLVARMIEEAEIEPGMRVLEPSAGKGDIAEALRDALGDDELPDVIEINHTLREILKAKGFEPVASDYMQFSGEGYNRVVMNPPFENGLDIDHVRRAFDMLVEGGRVVAIMGEGAFFRNDRKASEFREWLESVGGTSETLPEGTFTGAEAFRPTGVNTRLVIIDR